MTHYYNAIGSSVDENDDKISDNNDETVSTTVRYKPNINEIYKPVWVGAHPSLGERIAEIWLRQKILYKDIIDIQKQVTNPCGADNIRSDFCITHADGTKRIIEVKTVVDTDYSSYAIPSNDVDELPIDKSPEKKKTVAKSPSPSKKKKSTNRPQCIFTNDEIPYHRTAIFPWGVSNQKGPDGEPVVSARAIHHVRELTRIATGQLRIPDMTPPNNRMKATIVFVVVRGDAEIFTPNHRACPSFGKYLKQAHDAGVEIIAKRVSWGTGTEIGTCFDDPILPIKWPAL